jgi:hypothetical protein
MIAECRIAIAEWPSRDIIASIENICSANDVLFAVAKQWTTPIAFYIGDVDVLQGYDYPLHSFLQELQKGVIDLRNNESTNIRLYAMDYPTADTIHHIVTLDVTDRKAGLGRIEFTWCPHISKVGRFDSPYSRAVRLHQLDQMICQEVQKYHRFLGDNFPEYYPAWAAGRNPVFGVLSQCTSPPTFDSQNKRATD